MTPDKIQVLNPETKDAGASETHSDQETLRSTHSDQTQAVVSQSDRSGIRSNRRGRGTWARHESAAVLDITPCTQYAVLASLTLEDVQNVFLFATEFFWQGILYNYTVYTDFPLYYGILYRST